MYFDLDPFARAQYLTLFRTRFRLRRWAYVFFFTALYALMWCVVNFGRAHDHLLFPGFKRQPLRDLVRDPRAAIEQVYEHFGWGMSEALRAELIRATQRQSEFKSKHKYTLEEFGLSKEWIQTELGLMMDHYVLPR